MQTNTSRKDLKQNLSLKLELEIEINQLFVLLFIYQSPSWSTHSSPCPPPPGQHLWFHNDKLAGRILDLMTFEYLLAIEITQRTRPWKGMNKLN